MAIDANLVIPADAAATAAASHDDDPLWFKDAIIYQAHVKSFFDSNERRHRRLHRPDPEARLPAGPRHHLPLAAAVLSLAAQGRRLRHRRLPERPSELRHARRLQGVRARRARAAHQGPDRAGRQPHLGSAPVVPARAPRAARIARARVLRLERHRQEVSRDADHLHRHREVELDLRPGREAVLLAPLLLAPARSQSQQPGGRRRGDRRHEVLARHRASTRCGSTRCRTCACAKARTTRTCPRRTRC